MSNPVRAPQEFFDGIKNATNEVEAGKARWRMMEWFDKNARQLPVGSKMIFPDPETGEDMEYEKQAEELQ